MNLFGGAADSSHISARAQALRQVAEDQYLVNAEFNRAFVLIQYFRYLRRNPNDPQDSDYTGYDFWLTKLNQFNGNYINVEKRTIPRVWCTLKLASNNVLVFAANFETLH